MDVTYLEFSQAFKAVSHSFLASKLGYYGLDGWSRCVGKLAGSLGQSIVVNGLFFAWRLVTSGDWLQVGLLRKPFWNLSCSCFGKEVDQRPPKVPFELNNCVIQTRWCQLGVSVKTTECRLPVTIIFA